MITNYENNRIAKIDDIKIIFDKTDVIAVYGSGWISGLITIYLERVLGLKTLNVEEPLNNGVPIIIGEHEEVAKKLVKTLESDISNNVYYLSEDTKNKMDELVMLLFPEVYEKNVLIVRKAELDESMNESFSQIIEDKLGMDKFPIFETIEIETINRCNGTCDFCPINKNDDIRSFAKMTDEMFSKIIHELAALNYKGRVNLYSNNEPLMDNRIINFAKQTDKMLPEACKVIYTNGTLLTFDKFIELVKYLDILCLDIYYDNSAFAEISDDMRRVFSYGIQNEDIKNRVMVQFINRKAIRNNRGGKSKNRCETYRLKSTCILPFIQMVIRPDGKVSLCCNDPTGIVTLGDVGKETIIDIWNGDNYWKIRNSIKTTRQSLDYCINCDNYGGLSIRDFTIKEMITSWEKVRDLLGGS